MVSSNPCLFETYAIELHAPSAILVAIRAGINTSTALAMETSLQKTVATHTNKEIVITGLSLRNRAGLIDLWVAYFFWASIES